jgi:hypothetical protein
LRAGLVRHNGFAIERRPDEAPPHCSNPAAHVVIGPKIPLERGLYERAARTIVKDPSVEMLHPPTM